MWISEKESVFLNVFLSSSVSDFCDSMCFMNYCIKNTTYKTYKTTTLENSPFTIYRLDRSTNTPE